MRLLLIAAALCVTASAASAHSWYPEDCCNDRDCEVIPLQAVTETEAGWHVEYVSAKLGVVNVDVPRKHHRVKPNDHDGQFHGCFYYPRGPDTGLSPRKMQVRCFWYPVWM